LCTDWGEPIIRNNTFYQNSSTGIAGGLCVRFADCPVYNNILDNNFSALGGGFGILHIDTCHHIIANNLVINNGAAFFGAGISNNDCSPTYVNNTIADNHCQGGGGGFYCKDSVVPKLYNNIIFGNTQYSGENNQVYLWDLLAQPDFYYNDIEGGWESFAGTGGSAFSGIYENNISADPEFENNGISNYGLKYDSPCVDTGTPEISGFNLPLFDLANNLRVINERIDMGAFENQSLLGIKRIDRSKDAAFYPPSPNPASDFMQFSYFLQRSSEVNLILLDINGKVINVLVNQILPAGTHLVNWDICNSSCNSVGPGIYFAKLKVGNSFYHQKIIVD
jgi:parallel beta-helix repeat protein